MHFFSREFDIQGQKNANVRELARGVWAQLDLTDALNGELARRLLRFSERNETRNETRNEMEDEKMRSMKRDGGIVIIIAQSIPSISIPPKAFVKC